MERFKIDRSLLIKVAVAIVFLAVAWIALRTVLGLLFTFIPIVILAVGGFFAWRWWKNRGSAMPKIERKSEPAKIEQTTTTRKKSNENRNVDKDINEWQSLGDNPEPIKTDDILKEMEDREKRLLAESKSAEPSESDIQAQLEARRKRLMEQRGDS